MAALNRFHTVIHVEIRNEAALHPGEKVDPFTRAGIFRHYIVQGRCFDRIGKKHPTKDTEYIRKCKSYYVHAMRLTIRAAAAKFNLPAVLLAGTVYDQFDAAHLMEPFFHLWRNPVIGSAASDEMPLGPMSLQPCRALAALGYNPATVDPSIKDEVLESLTHDHAFAIYVCSKQLSDLRDPFFATTGAGHVVDGEVVIRGARNDQDSGKPDEILGSDVSRGKTIIERRVLLERLLSCAPVSGPD